MTICSFCLSRRAIVAVAILSVCAILVPASPLQAQRLSTNVLPEHYELTLAPNLKTATFTGVEFIDVTLAEPTNHISLNALEITFQSASVTAVGTQQTAAITLDTEKEQATFTFPATLPAGKATLSIHYTGILNNRLRGFYLSRGDHRTYAVTQFESTDARRAFPSFDEPAFKATYDISLVVDSDDTAISNSPMESDVPGPREGKHTLKFFTTPKMSTYLVAFLVGDFQCSSGESDGVAIRTCATPDKVALTPYSLNVAKYALHYYNNYFGIPYPLKKLDLIALPDFEAGAMENFGAITFRETALLVDPKTASVESEKRVATDITHEMAHQWFGDLVTMQWWDNVWLNEGFATWMENKVVAAMHPEWNIDQDVATDLDNTMNLDAHPTTRPIRARADTRDEIEEMFDGISYGKAGHVLFMVENYLGPETFRQGVHNYLAAHLYSNATAEDFWNAQTATSHKPVDKIMQSLVAQPGVPLLTFGQEVNGEVPVQQKRFFLDPDIKADTAQQWTLPVCFKAKAPAETSAATSPASADNGQECQLLIPSDSALKVPAGNLFFANAGGKGYYRSAYPPGVYTNLVAQVESSLAPTERISLIGDEWAQVRANKSSVGTYLNLVTAVKDDPNADVISSAIDGVNAIYERVASTRKERAALSSWIRTTFEPEYAKLGTPSEHDSPNTRELRAVLFADLGLNGEDPSILAQARDISKRYLEDPSSIDSTLGETALAVAAKNGDAALFDRLQNVYETSTNPERQIGALRLLARFESPALIERALNFAVSGKVRNQDAAAQLAIALDSDNSRNQAWKFIQANWNKVQTELTPELGAYLVESAGNFCSQPERDSVESFFSTHNVPAAEQTLKHAIESINGCIELRALQEPKLHSWLATQTTGL